MICGKTTELPENEAEALTACPHCGDGGVPANPDNTVTITLTVHELRILTYWAEFYAAGAKDEEDRNRMLRVVYGIVDRLTEQNLELPHMTFAAELTQLRETFGVIDSSFPEPPEPLDV